MAGAPMRRHVQGRLEAVRYAARRRADQTRDAHTLGTRTRRTCSKRAPICGRFSSCWVTRAISHTTVYLHLSRRHLQAAPNPLEQLPVPTPHGGPRSRLFDNRRRREPAGRGGGRYPSRAG